MWFWIVGLSLLFIVFEESIYYLWNRYIYGRKETKPNYWKNKIIRGFTFFSRKRWREAQHKQKISS